MTVLRSGNIQAGNNTPTGQPMQLAVDNPYLTKDDFVESYEAVGLGITKDSLAYANGEIDRKILQASGWINRHCRRWMDTQTIDEAKTGFMVRPYNPQLVSVVLQNRPYTEIHSIYIQVLKWFIQIETGSGGYLQDFYDKGFYRIVPLLSSAGTGVGSPIPAAILDRVPLGILWTKYTFGYGTPLTDQLLLLATKSSLQYQAVLGNRLWAPSQTLTVRDNGVLVAPAEYKVDYPNGIVEFEGGYVPVGDITADFVTNESIPSEVREACILLVAHLMGQAEQNPIGAASLGIQTFNISFGQASSVEMRAKALLEPYVNKMMTLIGL
jgi:hypothetical protein